MQSISFITVHRWHFDQSHAFGDLALPTPAGASHTLIGPDAPIGPDGLRVDFEARWGGVVFHPTRASADALLDDPNAAFPALPAHSEAFHALLGPIRFRGETTWFSAGNTMLHLAEKDPGGPVAVMTSAGYGKSDDQRVAHFLRKVEEVRDWYDSIPENLAQAVFNGPGDIDGMTFSIWRDDAALAKIAYGKGIHRTEMDHQFAGDPGHFDRSCFLRTRVLRHSGTWHGRDPLENAISAPAAT